MKTKGSTVLSIKGGAKTKRPEISLSGKWLEEIGFTHDTIVLIEKCDTGFIMLKACGKGMEVYNRLVKDVRMLEMKLTQVYISRTSKRIRFGGHWLERWGFYIGNIIAIGYEKNLIYIKQIEPNF